MKNTILGFLFNLLANAAAEHHETNNTADHLGRAVNQYSTDSLFKNALDGFVALAEDFIGPKAGAEWHIVQDENQPEGEPTAYTPEPAPAPEPQPEPTPVPDAPIEAETTPEVQPEVV